ncbi:metallophosphoesterase [Geoglobus acetivorans]|uniref:Metallophosphoesterase n=1 Tax=Geoglobus acetivorans TaxID=565033 RepID=A0ABZ3H2C8_GEOAI|nr:metallophosphoesterase [Geoglobus acetivorans]
MKVSESGAIKLGKTLVIADIHLGILGFPDFSIKDKILEVVFSSKSERLVINGDFKHSLGKYELKHVDKIIGEIEEHVSELLLLRGNHDGLLHEIHEVHDSVEVGNATITHGHKEFEEMRDAETLILGHSHPAVLIRDYISGHKERAWLFGELDGKRIIVMPAFNELCSSTAVNVEKPAGFIFGYVREFDVFTISGFYFGRVKV